MNNTTTKTASKHDTEQHGFGARIPQQRNNHPKRLRRHRARLRRTRTHNNATALQARVVGVRLDNGGTGYLPQFCVAGHVVLTCPNAAPTPEDAEKFLRSFVEMAKGMNFGAFKKVEQPITQLPAGTDATLERQRWNQYAKALKDGKHLPKSDWEAFLDITRRLQSRDDANGNDVDWFKRAEDAGAFGKDQVSRCGPVEKSVRVHTVAEWVMDGKQRGWMVREARLRWGGRTFLKEAETGIMKPVTQEIRMANPNGTPLGAFDVPERKVLLRAKR